MKHKKNPIKYDTIKIPEGLTDEIDIQVDQSKGNFTSRTDFIKYCCRKYIDEKKRDIDDRNKKNNTTRGNGLDESKKRSQGTDTTSLAFARIEPGSIIPVRSPPQRDLEEFDSG